MSNLSTNTLFHFTSEIDFLKQILRNDFTPRVSIETLMLKDSEENIAIPMKCFCDIPLSQASKHMATYGKYGIGLSKEWGIKNSISPLIYYCNNSQIIDSLITLGEFFDSKTDEQSFDKIQLKVFSLFLFSKPYEGKFYRNGKFIDKPVRFYDEREWRYILDLSIINNLDFKVILTDDDCFDVEKIKEINESLNKLDSVKIKFQPKDVKYIIVEKEAQILEIVDVLSKAKRQYSYEDVQILTTRIITSEQIKEDF